MTRPLVVVDANDVPAVWSALRAALSGDGPAIFPVIERGRVSTTGGDSTSSTTGGVSTSSTTGVSTTVPQRVAVVVETSGSTSKPKRVALSADALLASAAASHSQLGGPGDWLLALPASYIAGINVLVRQLAAGGEPKAVNLAAGFSVDAFLTAARQLEGPRRFTSLVPAQLTKLMNAEEAIDVLRGFDRILIGGQAIPLPLAAGALELGLNITRTYGSTETSGGCVYDGIPIGDTRVRIVDGRVELGGSVLAEGYLDDPRRTAFAFHDGWYRTDDTGELVDGVLRITGRIDDIFVSGGIKVSLSEVEHVVRSLPGLHDAVVVAVPHPEWGESAVVVGTAHLPLEVVRETVARALGKAAAPSRILLVDALPTLPSGKPDRLAIAALALR